ncbi:RtcB family protein [Antarcticibacterium arcticum]|uniref:3'-phosphate/5'-hydroxy nucleic acid ligase n=1 Tax=Antarcticibacterium arcticum TaxID=2585771 RepID=A0A5B8YJP1_9FLAO|nr:RtcB family protein [Antarcticibacterium arcticum]QED37851.1 RtcB family protein [Antarcticibacterium arcticum]
MPRLTIFGKELIDEKSIAQIKNCFGPEDLAVLTADAHYGYGHPIGGAVAYKDHISLSGVGFDIACGNKAVRTSIKAADVNVPKVMDEIYRRISFGVGRINNEPLDNPVFDKIAKADFSPQRKLLDLATEQLGTVGAGNHFVDLFEDEEGYLWIGVHFGSRGFGHKTTTGFIAMSQNKGFFDPAKEGGMDSKPILFDLDSAIGQEYIAAMNLAGEYAYAGRDVVVNKVLEILGTRETTFEVHNHHNFAWQEEHFGEKYWVVRKGCTPAFPGQTGFIGANMEDTSVIIKGKDTPLSREGLFSTVHGAGRVMSRRQAAGKTKWLRGKDGRKRPTIVSKGAVDFDAVRARLKNKVVLRGGGADEAPEAYKNLDEVLKHQGETIEVLHRLKPIGVAMAGDGTFDPYKD